MQTAYEDCQPDAEDKDIDVVFYLRDINRSLINAWEQTFAVYGGNFQISKGDIFYGAPAADAIVSPANSFGFMDGGIDKVYTDHFGIQMQRRLQEIIKNKHAGELLVGKAVVMPAYDENGRDEKQDWSDYNDGKPIKYLISVPTMRVPLDVSDTPNVYLAFKAVITAVQKHNCTAGVEPIRKVLMPGLATSVGNMPPTRCAWQMLQAYETFVLGKHDKRINPRCLDVEMADHQKLCKKI